MKQKRTTPGWTPERRAAYAERMKARWQDPDQSAIFRLGAIRGSAGQSNPSQRDWWTPERRAAASRIGKLGARLHKHVPHSPEIRHFLSEKAKAWHAVPGNTERLRQKLIQTWRQKNERR